MWADPKTPPPESDGLGSEARFLKSRYLLRSPLLSVQLRIVSEAQVCLVRPNDLCGDRSAAQGYWDNRSGGPSKFEAADIL